MPGERRVPDPSELVYVPRSSWAPAFVALALLALCLATFKGLIYAIVGGVILLVAFAGWVASTRDDLSRMPRQQRLTTAVIPPTTHHADSDGA